MKKNLQLPQIINPDRTSFILDELKSGNINKNLYRIKRQDPIKIVYFGTPEFSAYILEKLIEFFQNLPASRLHLEGATTNQLQFEVQTVVTSPDRPVGRLQQSKSSAVSMVARKYGIPMLKPDKLDQDFIASHLSLLSADLFIVASYGKIIPQTLLDIPTKGALNVHGSILPKYRGASPIQAPILNGDKETGITIMLMDEKVDHGSILSTNKIRISQQDTFETLSRKLSQEAVPLLIDTIVDFILGKIKPQSQDHTKATFCKLIKKEDGYFDINNPPSQEHLDRIIRAYYPWPTAWTRWNGKIVKLLPNQMVQMEGKKKVKLTEFLRGYPNFPIKSF